MATLLQLTADEWFWGTLDSMLKPWKCLSSVITNLGGVQSKSLHINFGKMAVV